MKDDMISRQAAIDATWEEPMYTDPLNVLTEVRDRIKALPSAQPKPCGDAVSRKAVIRLLHSGYHSRSMVDEVKELPSVQPEIIRCKDCKYYDSNDHCFLQGAEEEDYCSYAERRTDEQT